MTGLTEQSAGDFPFQNLPAQLTSLVGREQEAATVCALLQREGVRLVTLTGAGGIGKTRLEIEVASRLLNTFAEGVCFVPLAPISHPRLVIPTISYTLGLVDPLRDQAQRAEQLDFLKEFLQDKRLLLVLDNFEHVMPAAPELTSLMMACPHLKLLVSSREMLRLQGEHEFTVPPLALPKRTHLPAIEVLSQYASVALFLERALAIKPDLVITRANIQAIATICVRLDGLPLAIELAAARVKLLPPAALLQQLTHRFELLTGGARNAPERQQTMRNTVAWSYNLLDEAEQRLFRLLSVFVGGSTLEAIAAVSSTVTGGTGSLLDALASLIDKSLLQQSGQEEEEARFVMLETIREYGLEMLASTEEIGVARQAHATYYLALAEAAEPEYAGSRQAAWLERLEREHDNLRAVMLWTLERVRAEEVTFRKELGLRLGGALRRFWIVRGHWSEGQLFLERALTDSEEVEVSVRANALIALANLVGQDDYERAEAMCQKCLLLCRELGYQPGIAYILYLLAWAARDREDYAAERSFAGEALALFRQLGDQESIAWSLFALASADIIQREYRSAYPLIAESQALFREQNNRSGVAWSLYQLARAYLESEGYSATMQAALEESLALWKELGDPRGTALTLCLSGQAALIQGNTELARSQIEEGLHICREIKDQQGTALALILSGQVHALQGEEITAYHLYEESLALARETKQRWIIAACLEGLAMMLARWSEIVQATRLWGKAEALRDAVHVPIPPIEYLDYESSLAPVREQLGEKAFAAAWAEGQTMTLERVLSARGEETISSTPMRAETPPLPTYPAGLTAREVQVLRLVVQGLTNTEIADTLGLSEKTIAHHLTHIFNKTITENRAAAVAFAFRHGLA